MGAHVETQTRCQQHDGAHVTLLDIIPVTIRPCFLIVTPSVTIKGQSKSKYRDMPAVPHGEKSHCEQGHYAEGTVANLFVPSAEDQPSQRSLDVNHFLIQFANLLVVNKCNWCNIDDCGRKDDVCG